MRFAVSEELGNIQTHTQTHSLSTDRRFDREIIDPHLSMGMVWYLWNNIFTLDNTAHTIFMIFLSFSNLRVSTFALQHFNVLCVSVKPCAFQGKSSHNSYSNWQLFVFYLCMYAAVVYRFIKINRHKWRHFHVMLFKYTMRFF